MEIFRRRREGSYLHLNLPVRERQSIVAVFCEESIKNNLPSKGGSSEGGYERGWDGEFDIRNYVNQW